MGKIKRKLSRIGLYRNEIFGVFKVIALLSYYLLLQPYLIIVAIDFLIPKLIPVTIANILVMSFIYNLLTEKVRIRFNS